MRVRFRLLGGRHLGGLSGRSLQFETLEARLALATVPAFSSLEGANHTIFLDFDGHTVQGTNWNSYYNQTTLVAQPFDIDGNAASFSATELSRIEEAWKRVAEDFIPFNVNVTTVDPGVEALRKSGTGDTQWGIRLIITNESTMVTDPAERSGAGGIAYINSFTWSSDTPAWVFTTGGKSIAEAASHEAGHTLGLAHDGTASSGYYSGHGSGTTGWAPIMGVGYYQNVTQWDDGTYAGSNNTGSTANYGRGADDVGIIIGYNGFGYRTDDHGNTSSSATSLTVSGNSASASGIIERSSDIDVFTFTTGGGTVTLDIDPFAIGPNLDIKADLYDSSGALVASSNSSTTLDAYLSLSLAAGQYYLHIDGTGSPNYSDYGSIGRYTITGTIANPGGAGAQLSIADVSVNEGAGTASFNVTLSGAITAPVTVNYITASNTASAGSDFTTASGLLTFTPGGATTQQIVVAITNDTIVEATEQFYVNLSAATGATIADTQAIGTIVDNDVAAPVSLSISDVSLTEGHSSSGKNFNFTVRLSQAASQTVTVAYATADGTATVAGGDYRAAAGTISFSPGQTSKTVTVRVFGNRVRELDETFFVRLSNASGASIADSEGMGTIRNDDSGPLDSSAPMPIVDPLWYFEGDGDHANHDHDHDHEHHDEGDRVVERREISAASIGAFFGTVDSLRDIRAIGGSGSPLSRDAGLDLAASARMLLASERLLLGIARSTEPMQVPENRRESGVAVRASLIDKWMAKVDEWQGVEVDML